MGYRSDVETGRDRKALVADAGFGRLSFASAAAGVLTAYGAFAVLAGLVAGIIDAANVDIDLTSQWDDLGLGGGLVVAGLLLISYLFGGYVAGRMARRAGTLHGVAVFILGVAVVALAAFIARQAGGADAAIENLRDLGVPTTGSEWADIATVAGIASLAGMLLGAVVGGAMGERWHTKLIARALDPRIGSEAEALREAEVRAAEAEERRALAGEHRTGSFQRVRAATPTRTERVDNGDVDDDTTVLGSASGARTPAGDPGRDLSDGDGDGRPDDREGRTVKGGFGWLGRDGNDRDDERTVNGGPGWRSR
jgi:hypothetical protein